MIGDEHESHGFEIILELAGTRRRNRDGKADLQDAYDQLRSTLPGHGQDAKLVRDPLAADALCVQSV